MLSILFTPHVQEKCLFPTLQLKPVRNPEKVADCALETWIKELIEEIYTPDIVSKIIGKTMLQNPRMILSTTQTQKKKTMTDGLGPHTN